MTIANIFTYTLVIVFTLANIILSIYTKYDLTIYLIVFSIVYFIGVWIYSSLKTNSRSIVILNGVRNILFGGCLVLMVVKVLRILE
jgi:hypothetical protein